MKTNKTVLHTIALSLLLVPMASFGAMPQTKLGEMFAKTGDHISFAGDYAGNAFSRGWEKTRTYTADTAVKLWDTTKKRGYDMYNTTTQFVTKDAPSWISNNKTKIGIAVGAGLALGCLCTLANNWWFND